MPTPPPEALTVVLPVYNAAERIGKVVGEWSALLRTLGRDYDFLVVDDGSTDGTPAAVEKLLGSVPRLRLLRHDARRGFGACLRTALPEATNPVLCYTTADYPYSPGDLGKLLRRIGEPSDVFGTPKPVEAVSGIRTGRPVPPFWRAIGTANRVFRRVILGVTPDRLPGWYGLREHFRSWAVWLLMGVPLADIHSGFKLFRRSLFDRFPIQSDGDFAHAEVFAKLTFLTVLVAEEPLTPKPDLVPPAEWSDFWKVLNNSQFHPALPDLSRPPAPAAESPAPSA